MNVLRESWQAKLAQQKIAGLWRTHQVRTGPHAGTQFNSNDYLGLSNHPEVLKAFKQAADQYGVGSGSANTLSGYTSAHDTLRQTLREWLGRDEVLLFSSGYQANIAVLTTLLSSSDFVYADKLNHASLNDGMRFSGSKFKRYPHLTPPNQLEKADWIVTESLFSMDGDIAPLKALAQGKLIVDEAHSLGLYGPAGAGLIAENHLTQSQVPIMIGTFGKAIGTQGAFVAGDKVLMDALMQFARPYLFTTAMAPALAAASNRAIQLIQQADEQRDYLKRLIQDFRQQANKLDIALGNSFSPIQPILFKDIETVNRLSDKLNQKGMGVSSIRYPTVPMDSPRLRITLTTDHTPEMIQDFFEILQEALDEKTSDTNRV